MKKNKLALWLCIIFVLILAGLICFDLNYEKTKAMSMDKEMLQILANDKAQQVNQFLAFQKEKLLSLASLDIFKEAFLHPDDASKLVAVKKIIDGLGGTEALFTPNGILIYATNAPVGVDYSKNPYFISKEKKIIFKTYYDLYEKKYFYTLIGPVYDSQEKDKVIGVVGFHTPLDEISNLLKETDENKNTEVYLIDGDGLLLSSSKYIDVANNGGILTQEIKSDGAKDCLNDFKKYTADGSVMPHSEEVTEYLNYMGYEVFGAHSCVPFVSGCVIAEEKVGESSMFSIADFIKKIFN